MSNTTPEPPADKLVDESTETVPVAEPAEVPEQKTVPVADPADAPAPTESGPSSSSGSEGAVPERPVADETVPVAGVPVAEFAEAPEQKTVPVAEPADAPAPTESGPSASSGSESAAPERPVADEAVPPAAPAAAAVPVAAAPVAAAAHTNAAPMGALPATALPTASYVTPVYVAAPQPPKDKGNRGAGILIALVAAVAYAVVSAIAVLVIFLLNKRTMNVATHDFVQYLGTPSYYVPILIFAGALIALIAIVNRGGWWAYVLGAFVVAVIVYFAYIGSVLLTINAWQFTPAQVGRIVGQLWANPLTLAAAIIAREVPIWFGAWIAARGKKVRQRNLDAKEAHEKELAAGPQPIQHAG
ncbi:hypothetical protein [Rathayibacter soli]|uniref:hypothetical protein n=1 Tax=Rathayibacter soli TaxID=3144168 RepID=UPI0027E5AC74|nr:hypothetical protein [Glaciibacter superstes]